MPSLNCYRKISLIMKRLKKCEIELQWRCRMGKLQKYKREIYLDNLSIMNENTRKFLRWLDDDSPETIREMQRIFAANVGKGN